MKTKIAADAAHMIKLEGAWREAGTQVQELAARLEVAAVRDNRLAQIEAILADLDRSRWLRLLEAIEAPVRRSRPGLGSVRSRIHEARSVASDLQA